MDSRGGTALAGYESQASIIAGKLIEVSEHLKRLKSAGQKDPDLKWQHVVSTFGSVDMHVSSMQREIKEFLKYYVLRPSEHCAPPPDVDVPLLLSTRSHVEMESLEKDLIDAAAASAQAGQDQEKLLEAIGRVKEAVEKMGLVCDWKTEELKDHTKAFKSTGLEEKQWRKEAKKQVEGAFSWIEMKRDGKVASV